MIIPVAADGKIALYNGSTNSADLIADVSGYFSGSSKSVYVPVSPFRALDTRSDSNGKHCRQYSLMVHIGYPFSGLLDLIAFGEIMQGPYL